MAFDPNDKYGQKTFDQIVDDLRPDIVWVVGDYGTYDHIIHSKYRYTYQLVTYMPLDALPPQKRWEEYAKAPDCMVYYTEFAQQWGEHYDAAGTNIPHGVDTDTFRPAQVELRAALRQKLFGADDDTVIIGTVGRNQPRKRLPLFVQALSFIKHGAWRRCAHAMCGKLQLHDYDPVHQTFHESEVERCPHCQECQWEPGEPIEKLTAYIHCDLNENPLIPLDDIGNFWNIKQTIRNNPSLGMNRAQGVPDDQLVQVYQCMDLYVHPASGGGWELPLLEAASCGVRIVASDAPSQNEYVRQMPGAVLVPGEEQWDHTCQGYRVFVSCEDLVDRILTSLSVPTAVRDEERSGNRNFCVGTGTVDGPGYDWKSVANQWAELFRRVLDPSTKVAPWRMLKEA
jgi:glycosyltransferase involved in cell wall biosynthesis